MKHRGDTDSGSTSTAVLDPLIDPTSEADGELPVPDEQVAEQEVAVDAAGIALPARRGPSVHKPSKFRRHRLMTISRDGAPTTTRQAEVLNTALIGSPTDERGVAIGLDQISQSMVAHDPFTAYESGTITSPNVCVLGMIGMGKALDVTTPIPTPSGWRVMGDLQVDDLVIDEQGRPTRIVAVSDVMEGRPCFEVVFSDGTVLVADQDHQWETSTFLQRDRPAARARKAGVQGRIGAVKTSVHTTADLARTVQYNGQTNHAVALAGALELPAVGLLIDPYVLGAWLGDGTANKAELTTADPEIVAFVEGAGYVATPAGIYRYRISRDQGTPAHHRAATCVTCGVSFTTSWWGQQACSRACQTWSAGTPRCCATCKEPLSRTSTGLRHRSCWQDGTFIGQLRTLGVLGNKHIPEAYLWASRDQRMDLLRGLLDTDGTVSPSGCVQFTNCTRRLAEEVRQLCCSLGYRPALTSKPARLNGRTVGLAWTVTFTTTDEVFRLSRKQLRLKERTRNYSLARNSYRYIVDVRPVESRAVRCIQVAAASSLYLAGPTMIPTHNSSLVKTVYVERPLLLQKRRAVVVDKKLREGEGEYAELTRFFGAEPFHFEAGGGRDSTCMNLLDPVILAGGGPAEQLRLLTAFGELSGDGPLHEWHAKALRVAYRKVMRAFEDGRRVPVMPDLVDAFDGVAGDHEFKGMRSASLDELDEAAWSVRFRFESLLGDDLAGMFDRETSKHVVLHPKLTTFDISALPEDGPATSMVMLVANAWLTGILTRTPGLRTNFIAEEGWHLLSGPGGKVIRSKSKLSRGLGLSIVAAIHHVSDIPEDSEAIAMIKEAQTIHLFRQEHDDDISDCVRYFNLEGSNAQALGTLHQGEHLLKVGTTKEIKVRHVRGEREIAFTETDAAMVRSR